MGATNYSVEASVIKDGKPIKGILSLFRDEYAFGNTRKTVNWEKVECEKGIMSVKGFLRSVDKPCLTFLENGTSSPCFIMEQADINTVLKAVNIFSESQRHAREEKEAKARADAEEKLQKEAIKQQKIDEENRIREETKRKETEDYKQRLKAEEQRKAEEKHQIQKAFERRMTDKKARLQKEVEAVKNQSTNETLKIGALAKKASSSFLDNPYRTLGISCLATSEDANTALDKLKKLARLKALDSYRSPFELNGLEKPVRDLSVAQNAIILLKDKRNKWFWFAEPDACVAWQSGRYRSELSKEGQEYGTYDLFLANYLYALLCDPDFNSAETWKRVLNFYCFICKQESFALLSSRYTENELSALNHSELLSSFRSSIFKPLLLLCERDDLDAILRLYKYIKDCNNRLLEGLLRNILSKLVSWFTDKEADMMRYLGEVDSKEFLSDAEGAEIKARGDAYCMVVEPVFQLVLRDFRGDPVRYDMIKESYRHTTYQLMYELNKCPDKSAAVLFANKCYGYCNADDKKRIQNTFGEANIKSIDWNTPHTGWDAKGDDYYYGRGCPVDYSQALYWYHKAADAGNKYSPNSIGICYQKGHGVPKSDEQAAAWFEKAYNAGNPQGAYNLAECYYSGAGVRKDIDQALKYWAEAAKLGHPSASQRRATVFSKVSVDRRNHRARNHMCHDLGFQMTTGPNMVAEVTLSQSANVYLVNAQGYQNYLNGNDFKFYGGYAASSPYRIIIPSSNHWYVIVDNGDAPIAGITSSVKVKRA